MNRIFVFCFILFVTTLSGSVLLVGWKAICRILEKIGRFEYILPLFLAADSFFLLPVSYVVLVYLDNKYGLYSGYFLHNSKIMTIVSYIVFAFWAAGVCIQIVRLLIGMVRQHAFYKTLFSCGRMEEDVFQEVCVSLGIPKGKVGLYQSYGAEVPFFCGVIRPKVVLPVRRYTRGQLRVLFLHELNHYRQKDILIKILHRCVRTIHFFNPCTLILGRQIELWSEFTCDCRCIQLLEGAKSYFSTLVASMGNARTGRMLVSGLYENESEMEWRISHSRKYNKQKKLSVGKGYALAGIVFLVSCFCVLETTVLAGQFYADVFRDTMHMGAVMEESIAPNTDLTAGYVNSNLAVVDVQTDETLIQNVRSMIETVDSGCAIVTEPVYLKAGENIMAVQIQDPDNLTVRIGFADEEGSFHYIDIADGCYQISLEIEKAGYYRLRVENINKSAIEISSIYQFGN